MNLPRLALLIAATACAAGAAIAQDKPAAEAPQAEKADKAEPNVQRTVIEDDGVRVEELKVRGQTQRIVVRSKVGNAGEYEIIPADGARDMSQSAGSSRGAAGKRVWHLFSF
jgi:hypothetical protein